MRKNHIEKFAHFRYFYAKDNEIVIYIFTIWKKTFLWCTFVNNAILVYTQHIATAFYSTRNPNTWSDKWNKKCRFRLNPQEVEYYGSKDSTHTKIYVRKQTHQKWFFWNVKNITCNWFEFVLPKFWGQGIVVIAKFKIAA